MGGGTGQQDCIDRTTVGLESLKIQAPSDMVNDNETKEGGESPWAVAESISREDNKCQIDKQNEPLEEKVDSPDDENNAPGMTETRPAPPVSSEVEEEATRFARDGYLCWKDAVTKAHLCEWQIFAATYFDDCFQQLHQNGHISVPSHLMPTTKDGEEKRYSLGLGVKHGFREIVMRSPGRYELSLLHYGHCPSIASLKDSLYPLIPHLLGSQHWQDIKLCHLSLVVATPGSTQQSWHADGGHVSVSQHLQCHVLNVFLPLQDVPMRLGPTEFRPGSQVYTRNLAPMMLAARARKQLQAPVAPELQVGDGVIFDYRVLHRGKANLSADDNRTMLVLTFCKPWYKDVCNFPTRSMMDPTKDNLHVAADED